MESLGPPPEIEYDSLNEAKAPIKTHARQQGYVVFFKRTKRVGNKKNDAVECLFLAFSQSNIQQYEKDLANVLLPAVALGVCSRSVSGG